MTSQGWSGNVGRSLGDFDLDHSRGHECLGTVLPRWPGAAVPDRMMSIMDGFMLSARAWS